MAENNQKSSSKSKSKSRSRSGSVESENESDSKPSDDSRASGPVLQLKRLNPLQVYSVIPTAIVFVTVNIASRGPCTKQLAKMWNISENDLTELRESCDRLTSKEFSKSIHCFAKFMVDEEKNTTVSTSLMEKANQIACQQVFSSIKPSRTSKFVSQLCIEGHKPLNSSKPQLFTCNAYASAAVSAKFVGKTSRSPDQRFMCTYISRIEQPFFELTTSYKTACCEDFEAIQIPLKSGNTKDMYITILRPFLIGQLLYKSLGLKPEDLQTVFDRLSFAKNSRGTLLLPEVTVTTETDLWGNLGMGGINGDLGRSCEMPVLASIWHWTTVAISQRGVQHLSDRKINRRKKEHKRIDGEHLYERNPSYAFRLDSPFTFIVTVGGVHLLAGNYYGPQTPRTSEIAINVPEKIRFKRYKPPKPKKKTLSRKQKKRLMLRKAREKEQSKLRRKKEKEQKKLEKKSRSKSRKSRFKRKSRSSTTENTITTSNSGGTASSTATSSATVSDEPKSNSKSTSIPKRAWTRLKNIITFTSRK